MGGLGILGKLVKHGGVQREGIKEGGGLRPTFIWNAGFAGHEAGEYENKGLSSVHEEGIEVSGLEWADLGQGAGGSAFRFISWGETH